MKNIAGIYKLVHKPTGKIYIGQTRHFNIRMYEHKKHYQEPRSRTPKWITALAESVENPRFAKDFEAEVLEEVNDPQDRNAKEKFYIDKYKAEYGNLVVNVQAGGYYKPTKMKRTYKVARAPIAKSKIIISYDAKADNIELYPSIRTAAEDLGISTHNAIICYEWFYAAIHRYYLLSTMPMERLKRFSNYISSQKKSLDRVLELRDRANIVVISRRTRETAESIKRAEILISQHLYYLSDSLVLKKILEIADDAIRYFTTYLKVWAARHSVHGDTIETSQEEVVLYSTKRGVIRLFPDLNSALDHIKYETKYPFSRIGRPNPISKEYYVYYADSALRRAMLDVVRFNCASIIRRNDRHVNPNTMYLYMCGYYAVSKALGDPIATL